STQLFTMALTGVPHYVQQWKVYTPFFLGILLRQVRGLKYKKDTYFVITVPVYLMWPVRRKGDFIQVLKTSMY
ncbi:MAG: hypothetical protein ACK53Y_13080, partial [bacterium]